MKTIISALLIFELLITLNSAIAQSVPAKDTLSQNLSHKKTIDEWNSIEKKQALLAAERLHEIACSISPYASKDPWHISNLYNCVSQELFIPYQLWTGAIWDGDKNANCMHAANSRSLLDSPGKGYAKGEVIIKGPIQWTDDVSGEIRNVWQRTRSTSNTQKYYVCHPRGIGGIHNVKRPWVKWVRGLCHIPAGFGWKIGQKRTCIKTTIEIIDIVLDEQNRLHNITVKFWFRDTLRYRYTYQRNYGTQQIFNYHR